jgi:hypothetical protein
VKLIIFLGMTRHQARFVGAIEHKGKGTLVASNLAKRG